MGSRWTRTAGAIRFMVRMNLLRNISLEKTRPCDTFGKLLPTTGNLERARVNGGARFLIAAHVQGGGLITPAVLIHRFYVRLRIRTYTWRVPRMSASLHARSMTSTAGRMMRCLSQQLDRHLCRPQPFFFHFSLQEFFGGFLHSSPSVLPILDSFEPGMKKLSELCLHQPRRLSSHVNFGWRHRFPPILQRASD